MRFASVSDSMCEQRERVIWTDWSTRKWYGGWGRREDVGGDGSLSCYASTQARRVFGVGWYTPLVQTKGYVRYVCPDTRKCVGQQMGIIPSAACCELLLLRAVGYC